MSSSGPPLKEKRQLCYEARDEFFKCLEDNNNDLYKCKKAYEVLENKCPKVWIKHFEQRRNSEMMEKIKEAERKKSKA